MTPVLQWRVIVLAMTIQTQPKHEPRHEPRHETEAPFTGSGLKNPYLVYLLLMTVLFGLLILAAYLAWTNGWIPNRGTSA